MMTQQTIPLLQRQRQPNGDVCAGTSTRESARGTTHFDIPDLCSSGEPSSDAATAHTSMPTSRERNSAPRSVVQTMTEMEARRPHRQDLSTLLQPK